MIKLFYPKRQNLKIKKRIDIKLNQLYARGDFIQGNEVKKLEKNLSNFLKIDYATTCANGTDALSIALKAIGVKKNDIVIVPSYTFISSAESIVAVGAIPYFVDISLDDFLINIKSLENLLKKINKKNMCLICVELFGAQPNYKEITKLKKKYNLKIISDSAQSFGSLYKQQNIGHYVDIATTSFFPTKTLGCYGDGGAIFSKNFNYIKKAKSISNHGKGKNKYENVYFGYNSRLDTIQAIFLNEKLKLLKAEIKKRKEIFNYYNNNLHENYKKPIYNTDTTSSCGYYTLKVKNKILRNQILDKLSRNRISCSIYYPKPIHLQKPYRSFPRAKSLKNSEKLSDICFSIPIDPYLTKKEISYIVKSLNSLV